MAGLGDERRDELEPAAGGGFDLEVAVERWPIRGGFTISRGSKHEAVVVVARSATAPIRAGANACLMRAMARASRAWLPPSRPALDAIASGLSRAELAPCCLPGAARNALDCALWDLEAKRSGRSAATLAGIGAAPARAHRLHPLAGIAGGDGGEGARGERAHPLLKLKLGGDGDDERLAAVRAAVPQARLIVDANEAWQPQ